MSQQKVSQQVSSKKKASSTQRPRVLIADNDCRRRKAIRDRIGKKALMDEADCGEDAVRSLLRQKQPYAVVFLDHDFGSGWTGVDVAKFISLLHDSQVPKEVLVHVENSTAAQRILRVLEGAGITARRVVVNGEE